eukprot:scaffold142043_cov24-Tisochrysis_lutea.AAC.1
MQTKSFRTHVREFLVKPTTRLAATITGPFMTVAGTIRLRHSSVERAAIESRKIASRAAEPPIIRARPSTSRASHADSKREARKIRDLTGALSLCERKEEEVGGEGTLGVAIREASSRGVTRGDVKADRWRNRGIGDEVGTIFADWGEDKELDASGSAAASDAIPATMGNAASDAASDVASTDNLAVTSPCANVENASPREVLSA